MSDRPFIPPFTGIRYGSPCKRCGIRSETEWCQNGILRGSWCTCRDDGVKWERVDAGCYITTVSRIDLVVRRENAGWLWTASMDDCECCADDPLPLEDARSAAVDFARIHGEPVQSTEDREVLARNGIGRSVDARQVAFALRRLEDEVKKLRAMLAAEWTSNDGA